MCDRYCVTDDALLLTFVPLCRAASGLADRFASQREAVVMLHDAVENRVGDGGVADPGMPVLDGKLGCDDGGLAAGAIVDALRRLYKVRL